jgi:hypothetical protein
MGKKYRDADLILKLYDLRREEVMRKARDWFISEFSPETFEDVQRAALGEHGAHYRMVVSYWNMAASMVNHGAIDEKMFSQANGEERVVFAKLEPFIDEMRAAAGTPDYLRNLEQLVMSEPGSKAEMARLRERMKKYRAMREESAAKAQGA